MGADERQRIQELKYPCFTGALDETPTSHQGVGKLTRLCILGTVSTSLEEIASEPYHTPPHTKEYYRTPPHNPILERAIGIVRT